MTHSDPELLALLALGEDAASAEDRLHLAGCPDCRAELTALARPIAAATADEPALTPPAPEVWAGIAAALALEPRFRQDPLGPSGPVAVASRRPVGRRRGVVTVLAAAALVLVVGGIAAALLGARSEPQRLAAADLHALPGWQGRSGTAVLERLPDGDRIVELRTTVQPAGSTDREVWLMTDGAKRLVSLGFLHGTSGTFRVPTGTDLDRFRLVDVSAEPRDGDPAHSGDSIIRGTLRF
jgi:hypothetical protein